MTAIAATAACVAGVVIGGAAASADSNYASAGPFVDFGSVTEGGDYVRYAIVSNTSSVAIQVADRDDLFAPFVSDEANQDPVTADTCYQVNGSDMNWTVFGPGTSCKLWFRFSPRDLGSQGAVHRIDIATGNTNSTGFGPVVQTLTVILSGAGVESSGAPAGVADTPVTFATTTLHGTVNKFVQLKNTSQATEQVGAPVFPAASAFSEVPVPGVAPFIQQPPSPLCATYAPGTTSVLAPGQACSLSLAFTPTVAGAASATIKLGLFATGADGRPTVPAPTTPAVTVSSVLKSTGVLPLVAASPLNVGSETETSTKAVSITLSNPNSDVALQYGLPSIPSGVFAYGGDAHNACTSTFPGTLLYVILLPGRSCSLLITFSPTAIATSTVTMTVPVWSEPVPNSTGGIFDLTTPLPTRAADLKASFALKGAGVAPVIRPSNSAVAFGTHTVGSTHTLTKTLTNLSDASVFIVPPALAASSPFSYAEQGETACAVGNGHYRVLAPHQACTITFAYTPLTIASSTTSVKLNVYFSVSGSDQPATGQKIANAVALTLTGKSVAVSATLTPSPLDFGTWDTGFSQPDFQTIEVINTSDVQIRVATPVIPARTPFSLDFAAMNSFPAPWCVVDDSHVILNPGDNCDLEFEFKPVATGTFSTNASIGLYAASGALASGIKVAITLSLKLTGKGVHAA